MKRANSSETQAGSESRPHHGDRRPAGIASRIGKTAPVVLTIAGSDSGGGAGVQADARTIHALGGFACMAISALTAQNTRGVRDWEPVAPEFIAAQIDAVLADLSVGAIKTGLLPGAAAVRAIARALQRHRRIPLVIDPVIGSTSGTQFLDVAGARALAHDLLPRATVVTPNWPEAEVLAGLQISDYEDAEAAAKQLAGRFGVAFLIKGGHASDRKITRDVLAMPGGRVRWFESSRIPTRNTHGTGCVLSAAIATGLARGDSLERAVVRARTFLYRALVAGRRTEWGGAGPAFAG